MKTREADLDILTTRANKNEADSIHVRAVRDQIFEQAKDTYLEKKRQELTEWIKRGLYAYQSASPKKKEIMAQSEMNIDRIEREIKLYAGSEAFQQTLAKAAAKISNLQAEVFINKRKKHERQKPH